MGKVTKLIVEKIPRCPEMSPKVKINLKDKYDDGELDLSMCDLQDVPVKDIATFKKAYSLDLSSNHIVTLPNNFCTLTNIIKLDLGKNQIRELPDNFGDLFKLKHLDLYSNNLQHLPLSFAKLKNLKWLDLKDNPLVPRIGEVAGQCLDSKQCQECARNIVALYTKLEEQIELERDMREQHRQKNLMLNEARKQKLQEKKKKNLKPKQKQEDDEMQDKSGTSASDSAATNDKAVPVKKEKHKNSCTFSTTRLMRSLVLWLFILISFLFAITSIHIAHTESILNYVKLLWNTCLNRLPQNLRSIADEFERYVITFHTYLGSKITGLIEFTD